MKFWIYTHVVFYVLMYSGIRMIKCRFYLERLVIQFLVGANYLYLSLVFKDHYLSFVFNAIQRLSPNKRKRKLITDQTSEYQSNCVIKMRSSQITYFSLLVCHCFLTMPKFYSTVHSVRRDFTEFDCPSLPSGRTAPKA